MKIRIISAWHNEAFLAPFFLNHYGYADKIHVIMGEDTTDESRAICERQSNIDIERVAFPGNLINDRLKIDKINAVARNYWNAAGPNDWMIAVDADEFIFPPGGESMRSFLERQKADVIWANMWNVYRHETEADLDPDMPIPKQRRHGDPQKLWKKPIVLRSAAKVVWTIGNHHYERRNDIRESKEAFLGVHWRLADAEMAVKRHIQGRRDRISEENRRMHWGVHTYQMTEQSIRAECKKHLHDPELF